jgi:GNAT superfamily N-acetyltransferase
MVANPLSSNLPEVTLRVARLADAQAFACLATQLGYPSSAEQVEERLARVVDDPKHLVLAAVLAGRVVGWAHAYVCCLVETGTFTELGGLVVDESCRGKGVGGRLLARVEEWARAQGCSAVSLRSNVIRTEAHKFYTTRGYDQIKTQYCLRKRL